MEEAKTEEIWQEFLSVARASFEKMFAQDGQNSLVTFSQREDRACELGDGIARWFLDRHIKGDTINAAEVLCPTCGKPVSLKSQSPERREVIAKPGAVGSDRHGCYCHSCRKVFLPSGRQAGSEGGGLQPVASGEARMVGGPGGLLREGEPNRGEAPGTGDHCEGAAKPHGKARRGKSRAKGC